jgi:hypothetical protein
MLAFCSVLIYTGPRLLLTVLKIAAVWYTKMFIPTYQITSRHIPGGGNLYELLPVSSCYMKCRCITVQGEKTPFTVESRKTYVSEQWLGHT